MPHETSPSFTYSQFEEQASPEGYGQTVLVPYGEKIRVGRIEGRQDTGGYVVGFVDDERKRHTKVGKREAFSDEVQEYYADELAESAGRSPELLQRDVITNEMGNTAVGSVLDHDDGTTVGQQYEVTSIDTGAEKADNSEIMQFYGRFVGSTTPFIDQINVASSQFDSDAAHSALIQYAQQEGQNAPEQLKSWIDDLVNLIGSGQNTEAIMTHINNPPV